MQPQQDPEDLLIIEPGYARAAAGKRFANYIIDLIVFYFLIVVFGVVLAIAAPTAAENFANDSSGFALLDRLITLVSYALYMGAMEALFKGKSVGKFITKTRAVNPDGSSIAAGTAFLRGFSRAVPFCAFSALSTPCDPWQDRWTDSMVIYERGYN